MYFELARELGWESVDSGLRGISSKELSEWALYSELEPFGEKREDLRFAMLMMLIAEINRNPKKRKKPYKISDFLPDFSGNFEKRIFEDDEGAEENPGWKFLLDKVVAINKRLGGKDNRK